MWPWLKEELCVKRFSLRLEDPQILTTSAVSLMMLLYLSNNEMTETTLKILSFMLKKHKEILAKIV